MFNTNILKELYQNAIGYELFNEQGELLRMYQRNGNKIEKHIYGVFHADSASITAVNSPFCAMLTAKVEFAVPTELLDDALAHINVVAEQLNGTTFTLKDAGFSYSVSYQMTTASVGAKVEVATGCGEIFPVSQTITYVIIENGLSAYDVTLQIDGLRVPILSFVESKTHTTTMLASEDGRGETTSDMEAYGIDFTTPALLNDFGDIVEDAIQGIGKNQAHCVIITKQGRKSCHIMQFTIAKATIQAPQNVGYNISMTEVKPTLAEYNSMWMEFNLTDAQKQNALANHCHAVYLGGDEIEDNGLTSTTIFYGNGKALDNPMETDFHGIITIEDASDVAQPIRAFKNCPTIYVPAEAMLMDMKINQPTWLKASKTIYADSEESFNVLIGDAMGNVVVEAVNGKIVQHTQIGDIILSKADENGRHYIDRNTKVYFMPYTADSIGSVWLMNRGDVS